MERLKEIVKSCEWCGAEFVTKYGHKRYCSNRCQRNAYNKYHPKPTHNSTMAELARLAVEATNNGTSYGQLVRRKEDLLRCKDCKYWNTWQCDQFATGRRMGPYDGCPVGEEKDEDTSDHKATG